MARKTPLWQQVPTYPAQLDRSLLAALWPNGGVTGGVTTTVNNTMDISVAAGSAAVPLATGQGAALCVWDAPELVTPRIPAAPGSGQSRIDVVIVQVRDPDLDGGANNDFIITSVTGTPASSNPVVPATPANAFALYRVTVPGAAANLNTATLTDVRNHGLSVGSSGVAGRVYATTQTVLASGAQGVINMQTANFLFGGMRSDGVGLIVPVPGVYWVAGSCAWQSGGGALPNSPWVKTLLALNTALVRDYEVYNTGNVQPVVAGSDLIQANGGDQLTVVGNQNCGGAAGGRPDPAYTYLSAYLVLPL
jgi:hypothetical protein